MLKRKVVELYSPARRRGFLTRPTPVERARLRSCFPGGKEGEFQPFHNVTRESRTEKEEGKINETRDESSNRTVLRVKSEESNKSNLPPPPSSSFSPLPTLAPSFSFDTTSDSGRVERVLLSFLLNIPSSPSNVKRNACQPSSREREREIHRWVETNVCTYVAYAFVFPTLLFHSHPCLLHSDRVRIGARTSVAFSDVTIVLHHFYLLYIYIIYIYVYYDTYAFALNTILLRRIPQGGRDAVVFTRN